jgi:hypothetical protein
MRGSSKEDNTAATHNLSRQSTSMEPVMVNDVLFL